MAIVKFQLLKSDARLTISPEASPDWRLSWQIAFYDPFDSVTLSNGKELQKVPGALFLRPTSEDVGHSEAIGALHFIEAYAGSSDGVVSPSPDSYSVELSVPLANIKDLFELERKGGGPSTAIIEVPDLSYGWAPDGSDMNWEIDGSRNWLAVQSITFGFPHPETPEEADYEIDALPEVDPIVVATRETTEAIRELAGRAYLLDRKLDQAILWFLGAMVILIAVSAL